MLTDTTLLANITQHCCMSRCCVLLEAVAQSVKPVKLLATSYKGTQHNSQHWWPNNAGSCCVRLMSQMEITAINKSYFIIIIEHNWDLRKYGNFSLFKTTFVILRFWDWLFDPGGSRKFRKRGPWLMVCQLCYLHWLKNSERNCGQKLWLWKTYF